MNPRRPQGTLLLIVLVLYGWTVTGPLIFDDLVMVNRLEESTTWSQRLQLFSFVTDDIDAQSYRATAMIPWWVGDSFRAAFFRPLACLSMAADYMVAGRQAWWYHVVSVGWFALAVLLTRDVVLAVTGMRGAANWAAVLTATHYAHALPVVFISNRGSIMALACVLAGVLAFVHYHRGRRSPAQPVHTAGRHYMPAKMHDHEQYQTAVMRLHRFVWLLAMTVCFAAALLCKESALPMLAMPVVYHFVTGRHRGGQGGVGRTAVATVLLGLVAAGFLALYVRGGYGTNSAAYLDPIHFPWASLQELPTVAATSLVAMVVPLPAKAAIMGWQESWQVVGAVVVALLLWIVVLRLVRWVWVHGRSRQRRAVTFFGLWTLLALPLVWCAGGDGRSLTFVAVGMSAVLGVVVQQSHRLPETAAIRRLGRLARINFVAVFALASVMVGFASFLMEYHSRSHLRMLLSLGRDRPEAVHYFVSRAITPMETLHATNRIRWMGGDMSQYVWFLSGSQDTQMIPLDMHTVRIQDRDGYMLSRFMQQLATVRGRPWQAGMTFQTPQFTATIADVTDGQVRAATLRFRHRIDDPRYVFVDYDRGYWVWFDDARPDWPMLVRGQASSDAAESDALRVSHCSMPVFHTISSSARTTAR